MHIIRLRGPWQVEAVARFVAGVDGVCCPASDNLPPAGKATMPADWSATLGGDFLGRVRYLRTFNKPTGLDSGERVFLVVEPPRSRGTVALSGPAAVTAWTEGTPLGSVHWGGAAGRFEITALLQEHNRLEIIVDHPVLDAAGVPNDDGAKCLPGGLVGEVRLEIEE